MKGYLQENITLLYLGFYTQVIWEYNNIQFNSLLFLRVIQDKYISLYRELIAQLKAYISAIRMPSKGYLPTTLIPPNKLQDILAEVKRSLHQTNPGYTLVFDRLHMYYNIPLVTFGADRNMNLVIQFLIFIQPYIQEPLLSISDRDCSGTNTGYKHRGKFIHSPTSEQTIHCPE